MSKVFTHDPDSRIKEIMKNTIDDIKQKERKTVKCPYCDRTLVGTYGEMSGIMDFKCPKCKTTFVLDLAKLRIRNMKNDLKYVRYYF